MLNWKHKLRLFVILKYFLNLLTTGAKLWQITGEQQSVHHLRILSIRYCYMTNVCYKLLCRQHLNYITTLWKELVQAQILEVHTPLSLLAYLDSHTFNYFVITLWIFLFFVYFSNVLCNKCQMSLLRVFSLFSFAYTVMFILISSDIFFEFVQSLNILFLDI